MGYERTIGRVVDSVRMAKGVRSCTLLIGAGCSATAEIPTAGGFVDAIKEHFPHAWNDARQKTYPYCMQELEKAEQRQIIAKFVDKAPLNWAHIAIAALVEKGYVDRVLTTNFDPLVVRACALLGEIPAVYDCAASKSIISLKDVSGPAVFHLHGQHTGPILINTEDQMDENAEKIRPVFDPNLENRLWIVVGYSGENDPVFNHLANIQSFEGGLYWVCYEDEPVPQHVRDELLEQHESSEEERHAYTVHEYDADAFFVRLAQELNVFPPPLLENPFTHLQQCLGPVPSHCRLPGQDEPVEFGAEARKWIAQGIEIFEEQKLEVLKDVEKNIAAERLAAQAEQLLFAGKYEELAALHEAQTRPISESLKNTFTQGYFGWGLSLQARADDADREERQALLAQACEKYAAALKIKSDKHEALNNWGNALSDQAETKQGEEADRLFEQACEKYEAALKIKPDKHEALNNWGNALSDQARMKQGEEADRLFEQACEKYEAALKIKPDLHEALNNWGNALSDQARMKEGEEADRLFEQACEKYAAALKIKLDLHEALYNWGNALSDQAKTKQGEEADRLFEQAYEKYAAALKITPDDHEILNSWGIALSDQAKTKQGEEADRLFEQACEKYEAALKIKPDKHEALNNWGLALQNQAKTKEGEEADRLFEQACEKYVAAVQIKPDLHEALSNWAAVLLHRVGLSEGEKALSLAREAKEKALETERIKPGAGAYNAACACARLGEEEECLRWLEVALEHGTLPERSHLETDPDLDSVRDKDWFKAILEKAPQ